MYEQSPGQDGREALPYSNASYSVESFTKPNTVQVRGHCR